MPQMTGCELANQINKINSKIKMVFVTGYDNIINNTLNLEIFKKPLTVPQIIEVVNKYMNL
jgi:two-component SAPR family response regulator